MIRGRSTFSAELVPDLFDSTDDASSGPNLTTREREVLSLLTDGLTNKRIAHELELTEGTVRVYVSAVLAKLGVANQGRSSLRHPGAPPPGARRPTSTT